MERESPLRSPKMNEKDITLLTYKELQALALHYRVPGNIKKKVLVKVLQAAKSGEDKEVCRILSEVKTTRKRRTKKIKSEKIICTSTPFHSPSYDMAEDYYYSQAAPYQWPTSNVETPNNLRYEDFRQFLFQKIQKEYQTYDTNNNSNNNNNNDSHDSTSIVDLRMGAGSSIVQPFQTDSRYVGLNNPSTIKYQTIPSHRSSRESIILKKMLQAPAGANLGEIASPERNSYKLFPIEEQNEPDPLNNSDTLTAESDNEEELPANEKLDYYRLINTVKDEHLQRNIAESQYRYEAGANTNNYCQNWIVANSFDANNYIETETITHPLPSETIYLEEQADYQVQTESASNNYYPSETQVRPQFYQENGNGFGQNVDTSMSYQQVPNHNPQYFIASHENINNPPSYQSVVQTNVENVAMEGNAEHLQKELVPNLHFSNNNYTQNQFHQTSLAEFLTHQYSNGTEKNTQWSLQRESENMETDAKSTTGILDPYWPKRNPKKTPTEPLLEHILNFHAKSYIDYTKIDQTSCVYCYTAPIVCQQTASPTTFQLRKKHLTAEQRQHTFTPFWLLYNDTSIGMRMANIEINSSESLIEDTSKSADKESSKSEPNENEPNENVQLLSI